MREPCPLLDHADTASSEFLVESQKTDMWCRHLSLSKGSWERTHKEIQGGFPRTLHSPLFLSGLEEQTRDILGSLK